MPDLEALRAIVEVEFPAIVRSAAIMRDKLRVVLIDSSYIDFWWSTQIAGRYAHHWERRHSDGTIYRHGNLPHPQWRRVASFPKHFHAEGQPHVAESTIADDPEQAVRQFLAFATGKLIARK